MTHENYMREAIQLSIQMMEANHGGPFGAVIIKEGQIIGRGFNQVTTSNDPTAHAEVTAIRDACRNLNNFSLNGCDLYTSCEPCPMCLAAIYWARIDRIYYANTHLDAAAIDFDDAFLYTEIAKPIYQRTIPMVQLLRDEALTAFHKWREKHDKIPY